MTTLTIIFSPCAKGVYSKRKEFAPTGSKFFPFRVDPFQKGIGIHKSKQEVISCLPCQKNGGKIYQVYPFTLSKNSFFQIATLKDQLATEMRKRQQYISRSARTGEEISDIRSMLDTSLSNVGRDASLDPHLLEVETRKLDDSIDIHGYPSRTPTRRRSPLRTPPTRLGPSLRRSMSPGSFRHKMKK